MKAAKIVYALITILIIIPIFVRRIKNMRHGMKSGKKNIIVKQFLYLLIACIIVFGFTISLYRFTIGYEAPLFAERVSGVLVNCGKDELSQPDFEELLYDKKLASSVEVLGYDEILDSIDFQSSYDAYLSERVYTKGNGEVIYCKYAQGDSTVYVEMGISADNAKWQLSTLTASNEEMLKEIDPKMKFLEIN